MLIGNETSTWREVEHLSDLDEHETRAADGEGSAPDAPTDEDYLNKIKDAAQAIIDACDAMLGGGEEDAGDEEPPPKDAAKK